MDSKFKKNNFKPRPSFNKFQTNFSIPPDREPNEELIKQLFMIVADGSFFEINKFIIENNMTLNGTDDDNNSILHYVLENTNTTNPEKTTLINLLVEKGAPISIYNKNNISPLHLAAKLQLTDVIDLLLSKGADSNVRDSQFMTPLHYCVLPQNVKCIDESKEKDKLIPDDIVSINDVNNYTAIIAEELSKYVNNNNNVKQLIDHCKRILLDVNVNSSDDIVHHISNVKTQIINEIASGANKEDDKITSLLRTEIKNIENKLNSKLVKSINDIDISKNLKWGPDGENKLLLLPHAELSDHLLSLVDTIDKNVKSSIRDVNGHYDNFDKDILKFKREFGVIENKFTNLILAIYETSNHLGFVSDVNMLPIPGQLYENSFNHVHANYNLALHQLYENIFLSSMDNTINSNYVVNGTNINAIVYDTLNLSNITVETTNTYPSGIGITIDDFLTESSIELGKGELNDPDFRYDGLKRGNPENLLIGITDNALTRNNFTIFNIIRYYIKTLKSLSIDVKNNILRIHPQQIKNNNQDPLITFNNIIDSYKSILTLCVHISVLKKVCNVDLKKKLNNIADACAKAKGTIGIPFTNGSLNRNADEVLSIYERSLRNTDSNINELLTLLESMYSKANGMINKLNEVILNVVNKLHGYKYIEKYYNLSTDDFDAATSTNLTSNYSNILYSPLHSLNTLPSSLYEFMVSEISPSDYTLTDLKKHVVKQYYPKHANGNKPIVLIGNSSSTTNPLLGYFDLPGYNFNGIGSSFNDTKEEYVISEKQNVQYELKANHVAEPCVAREIDVTSYSKSSEEIILPIVSSVLDYHINSNKYAIFRIILDHAYNGISSNDGSPLTTAMKNFHENIKSQIGIGESDYTIIMNIILQLLNKLFSQFIHNTTGITSKNVTNYIISDANDIDVDINKVNFVINVNSSEKLFEGIKQVVNDIAANLINSDNSVKMFNQMMSNFDDINRSKQHKIMGLDSNEDICFEIDTNAINKLISNGTDSNAKDSMGNVPLIYAIDIKHIDTINALLLSRVSTHSDLSVNRNGLTPLTYSLNKLKNCSNKININKIINDSITKIEKNISAESNYPRILNRSKLILPMVIYMFNHQLTNMEISHYNPDGDKKWIFSDHDSLFRELGISDNGLPLIHNASGSDVKLNTNDGVTRLLIKKRMELDSKISEQQSLNISKINIQNEISSLGSKEDSITKYRLKKLTEYVNQIDIKLQRLNESTGEIYKLKQELDELSRKETSSVGENQLIDSLKQELSSINYDYDENYITKTYAKIFSKINEGKLNTVETDLNSYYKLWEFLLKNGIPMDNTQLPLLCSRELSNSSGSFEETKNISSLNIISRFWGNVLTKQINDYFQLPRHYERHNYVLNSLVRIYTHALQHTICVNYYVVLFKLLINYVTTKHPEQMVPGDKNDYSKYIKNRMEGILINADGKNALLDYILNIMPNKMVRSILHIHKHDNDTAMNTDPNKLLSEGVNIILENTELTINPNEKLVKNIKEFIIPYFEKYFTAYVLESQNIVEKYMKLIKEISDDAIIFSKILSHSINEEQRK